MNTKTKTLTLGLSAVLIAGGAGLCTLPQEAQALSKPVIEQKAKTVVFKDKAMKEYVLQAMKKQKLIPDTATEVPLSAANKLTKFEAASEFYEGPHCIKDLSDLVNFPNLTEIALTRHEISDLTPLTKLTKLRSINLRINSIKDLSPLKSLPNLEELDVSYNPIGKNIEAILEMKKLNEIVADDAEISNCDFLTKIKNKENFSITLKKNHISSLPKFVPNTKFRELVLSENSILDFSPLKNVSCDTVAGSDPVLIDANGQHVVLNSTSDIFDMSKLPKSVKVTKYPEQGYTIDGHTTKAGIIDGNILKPAEGEKSGIFSLEHSANIKNVITEGSDLIVNFTLPQKQPATPPVVNNSQSGETYDDGVNAPRTPEPFITAGNLIKEIRQTIEQNKAKYTNEQLVALNTKLADYEKQLKTITDSKENTATRVTKARKLVTELQEMRANPLSVIKGKVKQGTDSKAKEEKTDKTDKKPIEKIEKTDNLHDKRVFDKDKDKGEKQKGKLPKTSDTAPLGVIGVLAGMLGILAVKPKREKL